MLVFLWDVTERVRFQELQAEYLEAERQARERAEETSRIRENVLANVAHDLRNPLTTVMTSVQLLEQLTDGENPALGDAAESIGNAAEYMSAMVEDLVDVARIEGGRLSLDVETVVLGEVVDRAVEMVGADSRHRDVEIETDGVDASLTVSADRTRLVRVVQNLVGNAVEHSPEGETVSVEAERLDDTVQLRVRDRGSGIPSEEQEHLFEQFWQQKSDDGQGLGLGLAIVRGIVEAHDGEVSIQSEPGEGSVFCVDLPAEG